MTEEPPSLNQTLLAAMQGQAGRTCLQIKRGRHYENISYRHFQRLVFRVVRFFRSQGLSTGDRVAIVATNSLEWLVTYVACLLSGSVAVPLHITHVPDTLLSLLQDCGARLVLLQDPDHLQAVVAGQALENSRIPDLKTVLVVNFQDRVPPGAHALENVLAEPALTPDEEQAVQAQAEQVPPEALATIQYVTARSGAIRGAVFDHAQSLASLHQMAAWLTLTEDDIAFTVRPWSEFPSLIASLHYFLSATPNALVASYDTIMENMQQVSPTVMLAVPNLFERYYEDRMAWIAAQPEADRKVFQWALKKGKEYHTAVGAVLPQLRQEYLRADLTFFNRLRGEVGGRIRQLYSVGLPPEEVSEFFEAIGMPFFCLYWLTEAGGFPAVSYPAAPCTGTCGQVGPGFELCIAEDGEILIRGQTVMREYWRCPDETQAVIDPEGWLHSGDLGYLDEAGHLHLTGRKGHMLVLSTGRKIAPLTIESMLTASPFIKQAAIVGEGKPHLSAMLVLNVEALIEHFKDAVDEAGRPISTTAHPQVKALLDEIINQVNLKLDLSERIGVYSLLDQPLTQDTGELTASMKISRHTVAERHAAQIEAMYPLPPQIEPEDISRVQVEPERLRDLLEKENILDAWLADAGIEFLFDLARQKQIDAPSMVHICDAAATIAQLETEERPLSTALIVGDPVKIGRVLPPSQIRLLYSDRIGRMRKNLVTLSKMVDGRVLGYVVDKHGYVRGIHKLEVMLDEPDSYLLGPQFRHHAAISRECDAVVFFVPAGGRQVRVFAEGQLVGRYSNGDWSPENMTQVNELIERIAEEKQYKVELVHRVLRCAFQMSEQNLGAIFVLGNAEAILDRSDTSEISHFAVIVGTNLKNMSDQELITFAQQDGATVIDAYRGEFRGCMVLLRPEADTPAEIGPGKGARHSSAAKMSAEAGCLAITVSHDGPITIYDSGKRVLSL